MGKNNIRADSLAVSQGLATDIKQAEALILAGDIVAKDGEREWRVDKPGELLPVSTVLRRKSHSTFVSRGGDKLMSAVRTLDVGSAFAGKRVLDVGASTGGFTDCALSLGCREVVAVDVGHNQLAWKLRQDSRVKSREGLHICDAEVEDLGVFDWILADVSFNSLGRLLPCITKFAQSGTLFLLLIKPQFELERSEVPAGGIVADEALRNKAISSVKEEMARKGIDVLGLAESEVRGRFGNVEIFVHGRWP